jgi:hypothetical protein
VEPPAHLTAHETCIYEKMKKVLFDALNQKTMEKRYSEPKNNGIRYSEPKNNGIPYSEPKKQQKNDTLNQKGHFCLVFNRKGHIPATP